MNLRLLAASMFAASIFAQDPASLTITYTLTVSPASATLTAGASQQFGASFSESGGAVSPLPTAQWGVTPAIGTISSTGLYTAPASVSAAQTVTVTASSGSLSASVPVTLNPTIPPIVLPVEVMGPAGTSKTVSFSIPSTVTGPLQLSMQVHGLKYVPEMSAQVNSSPAIAINSTTATLGGLANVFGGIGGGFATLNLTVALPAGSVTTGANTATFTFTNSNGITSGFRVLQFNILASGTPLIPASAFVYDNPANWTPPLNDAPDIAAGQAAWSSAQLTSPMTSKAHCADCHTADGRDLKYFNYSNYSIEARSVFHGLTVLQGQQIASYIRSLTTPAPAGAAPWNPPYQPGPGLDSQPVSAWAAGAGLAAVLPSDAAMLPYLEPNGSTASWAPTAYIDQRNIPIFFPLLDWNRWLPTVHPLDSQFGTAFQSSTLYAAYTGIRSALAAAPSIAAAQQLYLGSGNGGLHGQYWPYWNLNMSTLISPYKTAANMANASFQAQYYSLNLWRAVKVWELMQTFDLEGMFPQTHPGGMADRGWYNNVAFFTGPGISGFPRPSAGIGNGTPMAEIYHSFAWYQLQLLQNDGYANLQDPGLDWPYATSFVTVDLTWDPLAGSDGQPRMGVSSLWLEWIIKGLEANNQNAWASPYSGVTFPSQVSTWSDISAQQRGQLLTAYTQAWFSKYSGMNQTTFAALPMNSGFTTDPTQMEFGQFLIYELPQLGYWGVPQSVLQPIATWAATIWPTYNWTADLGATCAVTNSASGQVQCKIQ